MTLKIGVEYERTTFDREGVLSNRGIDLVRKRPDIYHVESTQPEFEWSPPAPFERMVDLTNSCLEQEEVSRQVCEEYGVLALPYSENGSGERGKLNVPPDVVRLPLFERILGHDTLLKVIPWVGIHYHLDIDRERVVDQYNALLAFVAVTPAFTSTSLLDYGGKNSLNSHRQAVINREVSDIIPRDQGYVDNMGDILQRDEVNRMRWRNRFIDVGGDGEHFDKVFPDNNVGYSELKYRPNVGKGTLEPRMYDSAPVHILVSTAALLLGYWGRIQEERIPVRIADEGEKYDFSSREVVLPTWRDREDLRELQIKKGLEPIEVLDYLGRAVHFAKPWLEARGEERFLNPLHRMLLSGKNTSSKLDDFLLKTYVPVEGVFSVDARKAAALYMWEQQQESVQRLEMMRGS
ncbi:MAG: hypothetical protein ABIH82_05920 [Candidatus Woesearchaeota archaeon]